MYTGTTNLVAAAQESDRSVPGKPRTTKNLIGAMQLSSYVGAGLGAFLFVFARPLLRAIIGNDAISPAIFAAAMKYVRIRALGMPAAAILGSAQAACLGMQDIRSPLYVLAVAAVINFFGDMLFVGNGHPLIGGAAGAAWATVFSQYAAVVLFVRWLCHKPEKSSTPRVVNLSKAILEITGKNSDGESRRQGLKNSLASFGLPRDMGKKQANKIKSLFASKMPKAKPATTNDDYFSVRGFLQGKFSTADLLKAPSKETREEFRPFLLPVTTTQVGRVSGYVAMAHVVASSLGTVSMAAQQVLVSLFYCLCPIADSLSLTAQSFVPAIAEKKPSLERAAAMKKTAINFLKAGGIFGVAMVSAVCAIPLLSGFFTADLAVIALVNSVAPLLLIFFAVHGVMCASEGLLLGQKDLSFLGKMYAGFFFAVPYLMLRVKKAALTGSRPVYLTSVWKVFIGYQLFRTVVWLARAAQLQRRIDLKASSLPELAP
jgi:Na+-driven multidrug efflux pump